MYNTFARLFLFAVVSLPSALFSQAHPDCEFFQPRVRERFARSMPGMPRQTELSKTTIQVRSRIEGAPGGSRSHNFGAVHAAGSIDAYIYQDLQANNIQPADQTNDYEFIRRVTLDLTGRIPLPDRVTSFVASTSATKRSDLIDELLAQPQWVDKWTMYFGDLFKNNASNQQMNRRPEGRNAFYKWIHDSLAADTPYDQMATSLIAAQGTNSFEPSQGSIGWMVGGYVTGGPRQDIFDQQAANVAGTFLGITHMNCLLCHNGRGHLDTLSLWASGTTRAQAWQFSSFLSHTHVVKTKLPPDANGKVYEYWGLDSYPTDYQLNTTTGNRPARQPAGSETTVAPVYFFNGATPDPGEDYRTALARFVTSDPQFARATVNYLWAYFFGQGIVDPPDQFDPARIDPANPPPAPWTLQPSNPALLNALAQHFIDSKYDLKALMKEITSSQTYQMSSSYPGTWDPANQKYFARKYVRRLWGEEIHDAVVQASGIVPSYKVPGFTLASTVYPASPGFGKISFAMQAPDVNAMPDGGPVSAFLDNFLRGNRDDQPRKNEGSLLQALSLMNDAVIEGRIHASSSAGLVARNLNLPDSQLVDTFFLTVLSRPATPAEKSQALASLAAGNRTQAAEDLLWMLFNKVDFVFNY